MATYKVIQDIEAEDKLVGPLSLRQFIYAGIVIVLGFIAFQLSKANPILASPLLLPIIFFAALAIPLGQDQPSEVWLLAKVRFFLKPRRRIWNQDGISQLVTVTAPKKIEHAYTDGLSQNEVKSRLSALASTLDSRGWAVKNVSVNLYSAASYLNTPQADSDRLVSASSLPQDVPMADVTPLDDMMDEAVSPTAQNLERMISQSEQTHRKQLVDRISSQPPASGTPLPADYWFMSQQQQGPSRPGYSTFDHNPLVSPGTQQASSSPAGPQTADEQALLSKLRTEKSHPSASYGHMKTIMPIVDQPVPSPTSPPKTSKSVTPNPKPANPDIIRLANNDDLNIATIAREAKRDSKDDDEVVVSLH